MPERLFDLNIEDVLEHWESHHAVREIIANALDESALSRTAEPVIRQEGPDWVIRDFGRGLEVRHFTMNENREKLDAESSIIGKFGVGLKDALAAFYRHNIQVEIRSSHGSFRLVESTKHSFDDITTLHVAYAPERVIDRGTEVRLTNLPPEHMERARSLFLRYSDERAIEETPYGAILARNVSAGRVYINGVLANEEERFLFGYNITNLTAAMRSRLNRERVNVGRSTYSDRVKAILKNATTDEVLDALADDVLRRASGTNCEEIDWLDVSQIALNRLHSRAKVTLVTETDIKEAPQLLERVQEEGQSIVVITEAQHDRLEDQMASGGPAVRTTGVFWKEYAESFTFDFVDEDELEPVERAMLALSDAILTIARVQIRPRIRVSRSMRSSPQGDTRGAWANDEIVLLRDVLSSLYEFPGVLLHEVAHAESRAPDSSRAFESTLTEYLGAVTAFALHADDLLGPLTATLDTPAEHTDLASEPAASPDAPEELAATRTYRPEQADKRTQRAKPKVRAEQISPENSAGRRPLEIRRVGRKELRPRARIWHRTHGRGTVRYVDDVDGRTLVVFDRDPARRLWFEAGELYRELE